MVVGGLNVQIFERETPNMVKLNHTIYFPCEVLQYFNFYFV